MRVKLKGAVYLVGAGPGDAGLLTLRGAELLARAEVVIYDALVNPEILRHVPATAELIARGKNMEMPQKEITATVIANFVARIWGEPPLWITYSPLPPLFLMLFSGLYLFVLPYTAKGRGERRADAPK